MRESRAGLRQKRLNELPKIAGNAVYLHAQLPDSPLEVSKVDFYNVGFDATWEADLFGGTRRAIEAASADEESFFSVDVPFSAPRFGVFASR